MIVIADIYWVLTAYQSSQRYDNVTYLSLFSWKLIFLTSSEGTTSPCLPRWLFLVVWSIQYPGQRQWSQALICQVASDSQILVVGGIFWVTLLSGGHPSWWLSWVAEGSVYRVCVDCDDASLIQKCPAYALISQPCTFGQDTDFLLNCFLVKSG